MLMKTLHRKPILISASLGAVARIFVILLPLLLASPARASAYADPGTGAFVYQAAYAIFLGGTFYLRKILDYVWRRRK
jgi:hypothetical protein